MVEDTTPKQKSLGEKLQGIHRSVLYLVLLAVVSLSLLATEFVPSLTIEKPPDPCTQDAYKILRNDPQAGRQDVVILDSGWSYSTRGENGGEMEAVLRIMMRRGTKFAVVSTVEAQCPEIAQRTIDRINLERKTDKQPEYRQWDDYVVLGYFPDATVMLQTVKQSIRDAWKNRTTKDPEGRDRDVFDSPVLKNIHKIDDVKAYVTIAASAVMPTIVARIGTKVPVISMVTGVMFPEQLNYYKSGQLKGLVNGLSGCVELEGLMEHGLDARGKIGGKELPMQAEPFPGQRNKARASSYYFALHMALGLLILAVAVGNIGMALAKRGNKS